MHTDTRSIIESSTLDLIRRVDDAALRPVSAAAGFRVSGALVAGWADDWVMIHGQPTFDMDERASDEGRFVGRISMPVPILCPRSVWDARHDTAFNGHERFAEFMRTRKIPPECPELQRIVSVRNAR